MMIHRVILGAACMASLAVGACSSNSGAGGGGDGGGSSTGSNGSGPSTCKTYHACQLLTFDQVNAAVMTGGSDAGSETNLNASPISESLCAYSGPNAVVGLDITCGPPETPSQIIAEKMDGGVTITMIPNLGNEAISVGDNAVVVWSGVNNIISYQVTAEIPDAGAANLTAAKTLAAEVVTEL